METTHKTVAPAKPKPAKKKGWLKILLNFLLFGGWILVIGVGLAGAIVLDMYVF